MNESFPILIADSNAAHVQQLEGALREVGFNNPFHVSRDGVDVIHYLQGHGPYGDREKHRFPRVLFLELDLPKLDGFAVLGWLHEHEHCNLIPRLVLTELRQPEHVTMAYQLGVNTYLIKPATLGGLVKMMHTVFEYWEMAAKPALPPKC